MSRELLVYGSNQKIQVAKVQLHIVETRTLLLQCQISKEIKTQVDI